MIEISFTVEPIGLTFFRTLSIDIYLTKISLHSLILNHFKRKTVKIFLFKASNYFR